VKELINRDLRYREYDAGGVEGFEALAALGFRPAYMDYSTLAIYPSCYGDGRPAPTHVLDSLPDEVVVIRSPGGRVLATKMTLVAGFVREGYFYTRDKAVSLAADIPARSVRK
jgi:hypothetical protein